MKSWINNIYCRLVKKDINRALIVALFFSLPFDKTPSFEIFTVTVKLSSIIGILIIIRVAYLIIKKNIKFKNNIWYSLLFAFIAWIFVIIPVSINFNKSIDFVFFNSFVIFLAISISLIYKKQYTKFIILAVFASALVVSAFGLIQYFADYLGVSNNLVGLADLYTKKTFGFTRITSFLLEPLYLASFMALPLCLSVALFVTKNEISTDHRIGILVALFSFVIFMSLSRGGIYAFLIATIFILIVSYTNKILNYKRVGILALIILGSFILSQLTVSVFSKSPSDFTDGKKGASAYLSHVIDPQNDPLDTRTAARARAIREIKDNPSNLVFGIGPGQYGPYVTDNKQIQGRWPSLNNLPLSVTLELGLVGILLVTVFAISIFTLSIKKFYGENNWNSKIFLISLPAYLLAQAISYQTYSTLYIIHVWAVIGVLMAILINERKKLVFKV
jgi:hypothetical protein